MARIASPWFWEERKGWYVNKDGQRHFLGEHPEGAPTPRKHNGKWNIPQAIVQAFHAIMAAPMEQVVPKKSPDSGPIVAEILNKYLDWCKKHRADRPYDWYRDHIQGFLDSLGAAATIVRLRVKQHQRHQEGVDTAGRERDPDPRTEQRLGVTPMHHERITWVLEDRLKFSPTLRNPDFAAIREDQAAQTGSNVVTSSW